MPVRAGACRYDAQAWLHAEGRARRTAENNSESAWDQLSDLLQRAQAGDQVARERLFAVAYEELRTQARAQLRGGGRNTFLDTSVLVHESFLKFIQAGQLNGNDRGHFFAYAGRVMRSVIVEHRCGCRKARY